MGNLNKCFSQKIPYRPTPPPLIDALHVTPQQPTRWTRAATEGNVLKAFGIINVLNSDENVPSPSSVDDVSLGGGYKENQYLVQPAATRRAPSLKFGSVVF